MYKKILPLLFIFFAQICFAQQQWHEGDMIFRTGTEAVSRMVLAADESGYSHVGLLIGEQGNWQVLHATPEEVVGRGNTVVLDSFDFFIDSERATQYQVFHIQATPEQRKLAVDWALKQLGKPFTLLAPDGVYCTTLIWKAWLNAGVDLDVKFKPINVYIHSETLILFPQGLMRSPLAQPLGNIVITPKSTSKVTPKN